MNLIAEEEQIEVDVRMFCEDVDIIPKYETEHAAGFDLKANIPAGTKIIISPRATTITREIKLSWWRKVLLGFESIFIEDVCINKNWELIPTGVRVEIPQGYEIQVRPRSGLALKNGVSLMNTPGTIDSDYRGDIGIILVNHGKDHFEVTRGMKIAQGVLVKVEKMNRIPVGSAEELSDTKRGTGGFGHTGTI